MSKRMKRIGILLLIIMGIYLVVDWDRKRITLDREKLTNGWYRYSNDDMEFEFPGKLRNCYECSVNTGLVYTVLTDGDYILMYMKNTNGSYLIEPKKLLAYPDSKATLSIRDRVDSILVTKGIEPGDSVVLERLSFNSIDSNFDQESIVLTIDVMGELITEEVNNVKLLNSRRDFLGLEKMQDEEKKYLFERESGRFYVQKREEDVFFELQQLRRRTLYTHNEEYMEPSAMYRFFKSIRIKNTEDDS